MNLNIKLVNVLLSEKVKTNGFFCVQLRCIPSIVNISFRYLRRRINFDYEMAKETCDLNESNPADFFIGSRFSRYFPDRRDYRLTLFWNSDFTLFLFIQVIWLLFLGDSFEFLFISTIRASSSGIERFESVV